MDNKENQNYGIYVYEKYGKKWVRIKTYGHDFLLGMNDVEVDGKIKFTWREACDNAECSGFAIPTKEQWHLIESYRDKIDAVIEENNGDPLIGFYWSASKYTDIHSWLFESNTGRLDFFNLFTLVYARYITYVD